MKIDIRLAELGDSPVLLEWLNDAEVLKGFPMIDLREIEDAVRVWMSYTHLQSGLTATLDGLPVGLANLYIQPYEKLKHQCLLSIIVDPNLRGKGVGTTLLSALIKLAKERFNIETLHLEVYEGNPAISLYRRMGFKEYGRHPRSLKYDGQYTDKILMQQSL
jgi:RimJ/RimL family protein N-acetyltransferase